MGLFNWKLNNNDEHGNYKRTVVTDDLDEKDQAEIRESLEQLFLGDKGRLKGMFLVAIDNNDRANIKGRIHGLDAMQVAQIIVDMAGPFVDPDLYEYIYKIQKKRGKI